MYNNNNSQPLFLGIDGGGTKCKAILTDANGTVLGTGLSGPANPLRGVEQTCQSITTATQLALTEAKLDSNTLNQIVAGIGLAGVNISSYLQKMQQWKHPFKAAFFTTDMHIACLGAHDGNDGAIIITGTGSAGFAAIGNNHQAFGGHGFLLGDKASGAWLGLSALQRVLEADDGLAAKTQLTKLVCQQLDSQNILDILDTLSVAKPAFFAKLAPLVLLAAKQDDSVAKHIIKQAADYVNKLAHQLLSLSAPRLSLIGGIAEPLTPWLADNIQSQISPALLSPELGAVKFAQQRYSTNHAA